MSELNYIDIIRGSRFPIGRRSVVRMGRNRYLIYLPMELNKIWKELSEKKVKVEVIIEIPRSED